MKEQRGKLTKITSGIANKLLQNLEEPLVKASFNLNQKELFENYSISKYQINLL